MWYAPRALEAGADGYLLKGVSVVKRICDEASTETLERFQP